MTTVVQTTSREGKVLFGGEANEYYSSPDRRQIVTREEVNVFGEYVGRFGTGRLVNGELVVDRWEKASPVGTDEAYVRGWLSNALLWGEEFYAGPVSGGPAFPFVTADATVCPECDRFNTLKTQQLAWGDQTDCSAEGCSYSKYYSIGD